MPIEHIEETEIVQNLEQELSPEQIEQIMAKVQDIDRDGIAYRALTGKTHEEWLEKKLPYTHLKDVLINGSLGKQNGRGQVEKNEWAKIQRDSIHGKGGGISQCFNIVGRSNDEVEKGKYPRLMRTGSFGKDRLGGGDQMGIIFDLDKFQELDRSKFGSDSLQLRTYSNNDGKPFENCDLAEFGFSLFPRISPKLLTGIIFRCHEKNNIEEKRKHFIANILKDKIPKIPENMYDYVYPNYINKEDLYTLNISDDPEDVMKMVTKIVDMMFSTDLLVPVYDVKGNLWWPKRMSYEEVKKFVAERDAKDINKEEE